MDYKIKILNTDSQIHSDTVTNEIEILWMFERNFIIAYIFHSNATKIEDACIKKTTIFCWQPGTRETNDNEPWKTEATPIHKVEKAKSAPPRASPTLLFYLIIFFKKKKKQKQWEDWKGNTFPAFFFTLAVGYTCCVLYVFFYSFRRTQYDSCRFFRAIWYLDTHWFGD